MNTNGNMSVPVRKLPSGATIPAIGLGTFGSDKYTPAQVAQAVYDAAQIGYRHFDCASVYNNEREVGESLEAVRKSGVGRGDLFITSKLWNDKHAPDDVARSCEQSLKDLRLDYLDLYLVHWPFPNHHGAGVTVDSRDPHAVRYVHTNYMRTWRAMEALVERGLVRHIGTSNMTVPKLRRVIADAEIQPAINEMELHPHFQQSELFRFVTENGIIPIGYSPLGSPSRPERDRTADDTVDTQDPIVLEIARKYDTTPTAICIRWAVTRGQIPIPFSVKPHQFGESLHAAMAPPLSPDDMTALAGIEHDCRLIKGQVFLWQDANGWEDLWDVTGDITGGGN